jgi:hypothetical protein
MRKPHLLILALASLASSAVFAATPFGLLESLRPPHSSTEGNSQRGYSVAINDLYVVVGIPYHDEGAANAGIVQIYDAGDGTPLLTLKNPTPAADEVFGFSVGISGTRVIVGAPGSNPASSYAGTAYIYDLAAQTPTVPTLTLNNPTPASLDLYGFSVAIDGDNAAVGALRDDTTMGDAGAVHFYNLASGTPATAVASLFNPGVAADYFGSSVALSGSRLAVGAYRDDTGGANDSGIVYIYSLSGGAPSSPSLTLPNPTPGTSDQFGRSIGLSGAKLVVGAFQDDTGAGNAGSAYVYDLGGASPTTPLTINNPAPASNDRFGIAVAISGNLVAVGAYQDDAGAADSGSAYVFDLSTGTPTVPITQLSNPYVGQGDQFGSAVAIFGDFLAVGAPLDDAGAQDAGTAYLYFLNETNSPTFEELGLTPNMGIIFGFTVSISGTLVAVGAPQDSAQDFYSGRVYIYDRASPAQPIHIIPNPAPAVGARFGNAISLEGGRLVVGSTGKAYVYNLDAATPTQPILTLNNPGDPDDYFGVDVSIAGTRVAVGAAYFGSGTSSTGHVYLYDTSSATPALPVSIFSSPDQAENDYFGSSVSLSGSRLAVGATHDDTAGPDSGTVFVFDLTSGTPTTPVYTLGNPTPAGSDRFGGSISISGSRLIVGAEQDDTGATNSGSAYVYDLAGGTPTVPVTVLNNPTPAANAGFAGRVSIAGTLVGVGAYRASGSGMAYLYDLASGAPGTPVQTISNPSPDTQDFFGLGISVNANNIAVGAALDDSVAPNFGYAYVFGPPDFDADGIPDDTDPDDDNDTVADVDEDIDGDGHLDLDDTDGDGKPDYHDPDDDDDGILTKNEDANGNGNPLDDDSDGDDIPDYLDPDVVQLPGSIALESGLLLVKESDGVAKVTLLRTGGTGGTVTVSMTTTDGTAKVGSDFAALSPSPKVITFAPGISKADVLINITTPDKAEPNEDFAVSIASPTGGASLGAIVTTRVIILDGTADTTKPAVTFTSPAAGAQVSDASGPTVAIVGKATDNKGIAKIQISLNGGDYEDIAMPDDALGNPSVNFSHPVAAVLGQNTVRVRSVDHAANVSAVITRTFSFIALRDLLVTIDGPADSGSVSTGFLGTSTRQVGVSYSITATPQKTPAPGFMFVGWTVGGGPSLQDIGITAAALAAPTLKFTFREGLTLTAKFIPYPFTANVTGSFNGLIFPSPDLPAQGTPASHETIGMITATVSTTGGVSGKVLIDGLTLSFAGNVDKDGAAYFGELRSPGFILFRGTKPSFELKLLLDLSPAGTGKLTGTLTQRYRSAIRSVSLIDADRAHYGAQGPKVPENLAGTGTRNYTAILPINESQVAPLTPPDYPQGHGFANVTLKSNGLVSVAGRLPDGTTLTASAPLSKGNRWPLFQQLYRLGSAGRGCIAGMVQVDDTMGVTDMFGPGLYWFRPFQLVQWYPYGWEEGLRLDFMAAKYDVPSDASVFPGLASTNPVSGNAALTFSGGLLADDITLATNISPTNTITTPSENTDANFSLKLAAPSGLVSGAFTHSDGSKPPFAGIIYQKGANAGAYGYFLSTSPKTIDYLGEGGRVEIFAK